MFRTYVELLSMSSKEEPYAPHPEKLTPPLGCTSSLESPSALEVKIEVSSSLQTMQGLISLGGLKLVIMV